MSSHCAVAGLTLINWASCFHPNETSLQTCTERVLTRVVLALCWHLLDYSFFARGIWQLRCGNIFCNYFITNFPQNVPLKILKIGQYFTKILTTVCGLLFGPSCMWYFVRLGLICNCNIYYPGGGACCSPHLAVYYLLTQRYVNHYDISCIVDKIGLFSYSAVFRERLLAHLLNFLSLFFIVCRFYYLFIYLFIYSSVV